MRRLAPFSLLLVAGCEGVQSALAPAGREAAEMAGLFWVMLTGAVILWCLMMALFTFVSSRRKEPLSPRIAEALIIGGGVVLPTLLVASLLIHALSLMPGQRAVGRDLTVHVTGEQWWWRIRYETDGGEIVTANELRLPVDKRIEVKLAAGRVIHSFWVPSLAGKTDMFPGRATRMALEPTKTGRFRGQCAELCGVSHALMAFDVEVMDAPAFDAWLANEAGDAAPPRSEAARRGEIIFTSQGCGACHTVRGTRAAGQLGPDLTHVGARHSLLAATLPNTPESLVRLIREPELVKPGIEMPGYRHLSDEKLRDLAAYLEGLQ